MTDDTVELTAAELPEAMRAWLDEQPAVVLSAEQLGGGRVLLRRLPGIAPEFVARVQVALAKYREALINLT
jgi:hypothetical protein